MKQTKLMSKLGLCALVLMMASGCSSTKSEAVQELTRNDKRMGCTELELEMTEAEFFRDRAERNRGMSFRNVVMPLGYPSTYLSADKAIESANGRLEYLTRLHEVKGCGNQQQHMASAEMARGYEPAAYPMPYQGAAQGMNYQPMRYEMPAGSAVVRPLGY